MPRNQGEVRADDDGEENVYLFWPNIIGNPAETSFWKRKPADACN
jgi:hypothetical protein